MDYTFAPTVHTVKLTNKKMKRMNEDGDIENYECPHLVFQLAFTDERAVRAAAELAKFQGQEVVVNVEGEGRQLSL